MVINATLRCRLKETHPNKDCVVGGWNKDKVFDFSDTYTFDSCYTKAEAIEYITHDLLLVAGGGYTTEHVELIELITDSNEV